MLFSRLYAKMVLAFTDIQKGMNPYENLDRP